MKKLIVFFILVILLFSLGMFLNIDALNKMILNNTVNSQWANRINWIGFLVSFPLFIHAISIERKENVYLLILFYMEFAMFAAFTYATALGIYFHENGLIPMGFAFWTLAAIMLIAQELWIDGRLNKVAGWIWGEKARIFHYAIALISVFVVIKFFPEKTMPLTMWNWVILGALSISFIYAISDIDRDSTYVTLACLCAGAYWGGAFFTYHADGHILGKVLSGALGIVIGIALILWVTGSLHSLANWVWKSAFFKPIRFVFDVVIGTIGIICMVIVALIASIVAGLISIFKPGWIDDVGPDWKKFILKKNPLVWSGFFP